jgi:hypothetical protein
MSLQYFHHNLSTTEKGIIGTATSLGSSAISMFSHVETALRIGGLCVGLAVGVVTLISVLHDLRKKQQKEK